MIPLKKYSIVLPIEKWVYEDEAFQSIANDIDPLLDDDLKFAHAFYVRMLKKFEIVGAKAVDELNKNGSTASDGFKHFLSIQTAILQYLLPERPIRQNLIAACYHCLKMEELDITECAERYYGGRRKVPESFMVYFKNYGPECTLLFEVDSEDWTNSGAHTAMKIFKN